MRRFLQGFATGKQGSGVTIGTHAEQDQIKTRERGSGLEKLAEGLFIDLGGLCGVRIFGWNPENILGADWRLGEQRLAGHAVVAFGILRRDMALVTEEEVELVPWERGIGGEEAIKAFRSGASRERDGEATPGTDGCICFVNKLSGGRAK